MKAGFCAMGTADLTRAKQGRQSSASITSGDRKWETGFGSSDVALLTGGKEWL